MKVRGEAAPQTDMEYQPPLRLTANVQETPLRNDGLSMNHQLSAKPLGVKTCNRCGLEWPWEEFPRHGMTPDGRSYVCSECRGRPDPFGVEKELRAQTRAARLPSGVMRKRLHQHATDTREPEPEQACRSCPALNLTARRAQESSAEYVWMREQMRRDEDSWRRFKSSLRS